MKKILYTTLLALYACSSSDTNISKMALTETDINRYISVYKDLKQQTPAVLHDLQKQENNVNDQHAQFAVFQGITQKAGLKNVSEFTQINAKIGTIFAVMQASKGMEKFQTLQIAHTAEFDAKIIEMLAQIDNPEVPEATKRELRKSTDEMRKSKDTAAQNWTQHKEWMDFVIEKSGKIMGAAVTEQEIKTIEKHENQIMEAYMGLPARVIHQSQL